MRFSKGIDQKTINDYVDNAYKNNNTKAYQKYSHPSEKLINDVSDEIDITEYTHTLRDNDIRHIKNSHGEGTNEKYTITRDDIKEIPNIVTNYDKVIVKQNQKGQFGIVYVKVGEDGLIYYLEAVTEYGNEKLLVNKQMIKTGIDDIPNLYGLIEAINKKQTEAEFLNDLKVLQAYVRNRSQPQSVNYRIPQNIKNSKSKSKNNLKVSKSKDDMIYLSAVERGDMETAQRMVVEAQLKKAAAGNACDSFCNYSAILISTGNQPSAIAA